MKFPAICLGLALCCACSPGSPGPSGHSIELADSRAVELIRNSESFVEPIYLEVWSHVRGRTAERLQSEGWVEFTEGPQKIRLTDFGRTMGAREKEFQSGLPVYFFPVARREIVELLEIHAPKSQGATRIVRFKYRKLPTRLGLTLVEHGTPIDDLRSHMPVRGSALFGADAEGWHVDLIEL